MKEQIKALRLFLPALLLSGIFSFMLFIYEPIILYSSNIDDFWFDFRIIFQPTLLAFLISFLALTAIFMIFYTISKRFNRPLVFYIPYLFFFVAFLIFYIHGNFFSSSLPALDGEVINWGNYVSEQIISTVICILVIAGTIFATVKLKPAKCLKYSSYLALAIFAMLSVSTISTFLTTDALKEKAVVTYATDKNLNLYSTDQNLLILLVDAVDSKRFYDATSAHELYDETFQDFTYFPDTVGAYRLTRDSIPFIFTGIWNHNETDFATYSTNAYNNSKLFKTLSSQDYNMNFFDDDFTWQSREALKFDNITTRIRDINTSAFIKEEVKYILFKYLPYPLKHFAHAENINFSSTGVTDEGAPFEWYNIPNYHNITENNIETTNQKVFQFLHLEGAHVPYTMNENLEIVEEATYEQKCVATLKIVNAYLNRLRESGVYDNSSIIVMADHGSSLPVNANPILYIKGQQESHPVSISEKAIWYPDLQDAYDELLSGESSSEIFTNVPDEHRDRIIILNPWKKEDHMDEYIQTGKAWELSTIIKTGKTYDR